MMTSPMLSLTSALDPCSLVAVAELPERMHFGTDLLQLAPAWDVDDQNMLHLRTTHAIAERVKIATPATL